MSRIGDLWKRAEQTGRPVPVGDVVVCDTCDADYTDRPDSGGFIFGRDAYCPPCAERALPNIKHYGEESHIKARCPDGQSFADFVRTFRGPDAAIGIERGA